jgi:hypothetical protein
MKSSISQMEGLAQAQVIHRVWIASMVIISTKMIML